MIDDPKTFCLEDHHVHSVFSDGASTLEENLAAAHAMGLRRLGFVDHVRRDTTYVPDFVAAVRRLQASTDITLTAGIEAKLLDEAGTLDMPADHARLADVVVIADHQFPYRDTCLHPAQIRRMLEDGTLTEAAAVDAVVNATVNGLRRNQEHVLLVAHLFSILPKVGIDEAAVTDAHIDALSAAALAADAAVEISERWRCPGLRVAQGLAANGVRLVASTDAHQHEKIGQYSTVRTILAGLTGRAGRSAAA